MAIKEEALSRRERRRLRRMRRQPAGGPDSDGDKRAVYASRDPLHVVDRLGRPTSLCGLWGGAAGFLVLGGPSTREIAGLPDLLRSRGVLSLGVNNAAAAYPVRACTFSDPPAKFHHGLFLDPSLIKFVPEPKLRKGSVRVKHADGWFQATDLHVRDFPNTWGYKRISEWRAEQFLTSDGANWGNNDDGVKATGRPKFLCTMLLGLRLMHYLGCDRVYLLGADFRMSPDAGYSFAQRRDAGACKSNEAIYKNANDYLCEVRPFLDAARCYVYNCNPASALEAFDYVPFEQAARDCRNGVPPEPFDLAGWYDSKGNGRV